MSQTLTVQSALPLTHMLRNSFHERPSTASLCPSTDSADSEGCDNVEVWRLGGGGGGGEVTTLLSDHCTPKPYPFIMYLLNLCTL